jgi:hypothetical protein
VKASVRRSILVGEMPFAVLEIGLNIIVRVRPLVSGSSIADLDIDDDFGCIVYQVMCVTGAGLKASAHARRELGIAFVSSQRGMAAEDVDELVLFGVTVAKGRDRLRGETG